MKNKIKQFLVYSTPILLLIIFLIFFYYTSREIKFEGVIFEDVVENITNESSPHYIYFTLANYKFKPVECTATLFLIQGEELLNEKSYYLGHLDQRTKLKYKILFDMPQGDTNIKVIKNCTFE